MHGTMNVKFIFHGLKLMVAFLSLHVSTEHLVIPCVLDI